MQWEKSEPRIIGVSLWDVKNGDNFKPDEKKGGWVDMRKWDATQGKKGAGSVFNFGIMDGTTKDWIWADTGAATDLSEITVSRGKREDFEKAGFGGDNPYFNVTVYCVVCEECEFGAAKG